MHICMKFCLDSNKSNSIVIYLIGRWDEKEKEVGDGEEGKKGEEGEEGEEGERMQEMTYQKSCGPLGYCQAPNYTPSNHTYRMTSVQIS